MITELMQGSSRMRHEIQEIPDAVERLLSNGSGDIAAAADQIKDLNPAIIITVARGSSDHVCTFLKYATELLLGIPVASVGPSISSIYNAPLRLKNSVCISISQSGKSPDIVAMAKTAKRDGALSLAITNDITSPLALASDYPLDIHAGTELSVAATKTFVTSAVAGLMLLAEWCDDRELKTSIQNLPKALARATFVDWPEVCQVVKDKQSLFTLGRGPVWAISNEAALKFKETCQIHAESFSSAEVLHGPVSIIDTDFPVLAFAVGDAAEKSVTTVADQIARKGAQVYVTSDYARIATAIDRIHTGHPLSDPISLIVSFYAMIERVATTRGINPDTPRHLKKVTRTI